MARTITNQEFDKEVQRIASTADRARDLALQRVERMRELAGGGAVRELARRRTRDGTEAIGTIEAATRLLGQTRTITRLREDRKRLGSQDGGEADDTIVAGQITDRRRPLAGATVVFTIDRDRVVGEATVDASGAFTFKRPREEFTRMVAGSRSLAIVVRDAAGREVFNTTAAIRASGAIVLNIDVSDRPAPPVAPPGPSNDTPESPRASVGLDDIKGLGPARLSRLAEAGIADAEAVARQDPGELARVLRVNRQQATEIIAAARKKPKP